MKHEIKVSWSGRCPNLCSGDWAISIDGKDIKIPEERISKPMDTYGEYEIYYIDENWSEQVETYKDGQLFPQWIDDKDNLWIKDEVARIVPTEEVMTVLESLYKEIQKYDWRFNSCGGCI